MSKSSSFIVGIDLGTTNCAVAFWERRAAKKEVQLFQIPQLYRQGEIRHLALLPSFIYLPFAEEFSEEEKKLPWSPNASPFIIGQWAQQLGTITPTRLVSSAKSWLSHAYVDRKSALLPLEAADEKQRISPLQATFLLLQYIKEAWNHEKGNQLEDRLEEQEIFLTIPASFDEVARQLTLEAALENGLKHVILIEEPLAAFYHWLNHDKHVESLEKGAEILVCDVGGGTTDFTLLKVGEEEGKKSFERTHVGRHLLLGGENMDQALCHEIEQRLTQEASPLESTQWLELRHQVRLAKEALLQEKGPDVYRLWISGGSQGVIKGSRSAVVTREEAEKTLLDGFFGVHSYLEAQKLKKRSGLSAVGLPYEADPSITKHLANFLSQSSHLEGPKYVLFNGGALKPQLFQERILHSLSLWFSSEKGQKPIVLQNPSMDLAVAYGAVYYGKAREGVGKRVMAGAPRSYYLGIDEKTAEGQWIKKALSVVPYGTAEGSTFSLETSFSLLPNTPVKFPLFTSLKRKEDAFGKLVGVDLEQMSPLPVLQTVIQCGTKREEPLPVRLAGSYSEMGTLSLWLESLETPHKWNLEFFLRAQDEKIDSNSVEKIIPSSRIDEAKKLLFEAFSPGSQDKLKHIYNHLEACLGAEKEEWSLSLLRVLVDVLLEQAHKTSIYSFYEQKWWNLVGFFLRPGIGHPLDGHRLKELWKMILGSLKKPAEEEALTQRWICVRRVAAGFQKGQQNQLFSELFSLVQQPKASKQVYAYSEKVRTLASLEFVETALKIKAGKYLLKRIMEEKALPVDFWALGRIGTRQLLWAGAQAVIPRQVCEEWVEELLQLKKVEEKSMLPMLAMLARQTDVRELNLSSSVVVKIKQYLERFASGRDYVKGFEETIPLTSKEQDWLFGDHLPLGLRLDSI